MKFSMNIKCILFCVVFLQVAGAVEDSVKEVSESIANDALSSSNTLELYNINPDWNKEDTEAILNEMERRFVEDESLEKFTDPLVWINKPISTKNQLNRALYLQKNMVTNSGSQRLLGITDIRLGRICSNGQVECSFGKLTANEISFLSNLPHVRLFHLAGCSNTAGELMPLYESLSRSALVSFHIPNTTLHDSVLPLMASIVTLRSINISGNEDILSHKLTEFLTFLTNRLEELYLRGTELTDEGLVNLSRFNRLKQLNIAYCHHLSPLVVDNIVWKLPEGLKFTDVNNNVKIIKKNELSTPKELKIAHSPLGILGLDVLLESVPTDTLEELDLTGANIASKTLQKISRFQRLKKLNLDCCFLLGSSELEELLADLPDTIEELCLMCTELTDGGLQKISRFQRLKKLNIGGCYLLSSDALENLLANLSINIEELYLTRTNITDGGLKKLSRFQRLNILGLGVCRRLNSTGLEYMLTVLPDTIEELSLTETDLSDKGLKVLSRFRLLKRLDISFCIYLSPSAVENILWKLPEGLVLTDIEHNTRIIRKRNLISPKKDKPKKEVCYDCTIL